MAFYAKNSEKKVFHQVLIHQLKRLLDDEDEASVEDYLRAKLDQISETKSELKKEEFLELLLKLMNDVSLTYHQFNKSLIQKNRSISISSDELNIANDQLSISNTKITKSVDNLKLSLKDLLGKENQEEISFAAYELEELTEVIKSLIHKNRISSKKLKRSNKKFKLKSSELELKNKEITAGLEYAKRMQDILLSDSKLLRNVFPDSFLLDLPKDIVSGDFYWVHQDSKKVIFAVADCTGHGVPGAFTSIISTMLLNEMVREAKVHHPSEMLVHLHERIVEVFKINEGNSYSHDGLDIALCVIDFENDHLQFAGAGRPLILIRDNEIKILKGANKAVGGLISIKSSDYFTQGITLENNDMIYLFSDGYIDQLGGDSDSKFSSKSFQKLLLEISPEKSQTQYDKLVEAHMSWKKNKKQIDDILVLGFRYQIN